MTYPCHSNTDALNTANLSSLKERRTQLCCKYVQKVTLKDHPINFLKPRTTSSGHSYNLQANDNNRNIVYADSCCCRTQCSGSFISFASKCVNNFYCLHIRYSVNYLLIVNLNPFNSVNSAMWQINGIYIYIYIYIHIYINRPRTVEFNIDKEPLRGV